MRGGSGEGERSLEQTPTWAVAAVCFVLVAISIVLEYILHLVGSWLKKRHKRALYEALEKIKAELMILGFISLLLTVGQGPISEICVPRSVGNSWHPCSDSDDAEEYEDPCANEDKVQLVSADGIHQLHLFIFALAVAHVLYCFTTLALGRLKMRKWKVWEDETKTLEYQFYNDPERFRFARETSFGRRHLNIWSKSPILLWIVCFFRQFITTVAKVDYMTLRHGFITAHLAPQSQHKFDFQKYISRSLEEDFKVVVGISPIIWLFAVWFLISNTHGWRSSFWLPFIPLIIVLLVGAKLQMIITEMGIRIQDRGEVVKGTLVVHPGDELFWFNRPRFILFLIHFVLFQNAFQLAFFFWSWYEFGLTSCFHQNPEDIIIRISMGVLIQFLCSYATLPLYALVTQMGSTMKRTVFSDQVATALRNWHKTARKKAKQQGRLSGNTTPFSSRPATPLYGMSPVHLLHNYRQTVEDSVQTSPRASNYDGEGLGFGFSTSPDDHPEGTDDGRQHDDDNIQQQQQHNIQEQSSAQHTIEIGLTDFSFADHKR